MLQGCGLTEAYAKDLAGRKGADARIRVDPVRFIDDEWQSINLGELGTFYTSRRLPSFPPSNPSLTPRSGAEAGMEEAFLSLNIRPEVVKTIVGGKIDDQLLGHRDATDWATMAISGEYGRYKDRVAA